MGEVIKAKVLVLHGYNDPIVPMKDLFAFQKKMEENGTDWQTQVFSNTYHAFATPGSNDPTSGILYN